MGPEVFYPQYKKTRGLGLTWPVHMPLTRGTMRSRQEQHFSGPGLERLSEIVPSRTPHAFFWLTSNTELITSQADNFHCGFHQAREEEETHTADVLNLLSEADVFLPAAFLSHTGDRHTFTGITKKDGKPTNRRIDYVGLPTDWLQATTTSNVIYDFNTVATKADHFPTYVHFKFTTTTQLADSPHLRLDKTWIDTREPLPLAEAVAQLCTCPVPAWDQDVHTHRHSIHTFHHDWLDPVPKQKSDAIQPYATPQILFASKRVTQIHRAIIKIYREKTKVLSRFMIHAWVASAIKPDNIFDRKRAKKAGCCPYVTINLTDIDEHQPERGSFAIAFATVECQRYDCDYRVALIKITPHATQKQQKVNLQQVFAQYFLTLSTTYPSHVESSGRRSSL